jgi:hypothetical protein
VPFNDELVEVTGLGGFQSVQGQVVDHEQLHAVQLAHLVFIPAVEAGGFEAYEQLVGAFGMNAVPAAQAGSSKTTDLYKRRANRRHQPGRTSTQQIPSESDDARIRPFQRSRVWWASADATIDSWQLLSLLSSTRW